MAAFFEPARSAVIPNIAAEGEVLVANTLSSATWSVNLLIGASVGGVVAAFFGRDTRLRPECAVVSGVGDPDRRNAIRRAACRSRGSAAAARSRGLFSGAGRDSLYPQSSDAASGGLCQGRRTDGRAELGDLHGDGSARICGAWPRHRCRGRRHARHEHPARRARCGSAGGAADFGALGGPERSPAAAGNSVRISRRSARGLWRARRQPERVDGGGLRHAGARGRIDRLGVLDDAACSFIPKTAFVGASSPPTLAWAALRSL